MRTEPSFSESKDQEASLERVYQRPRSHRGLIRVNSSCCGRLRRRRICKIGGTWAEPYTSTFAIADTHTVTVRSFGFANLVGERVARGNRLQCLPLDDTVTFRVLRQNR